MSTKTKTAKQPSMDLETLLEAPAANDVYRCTPDDPVAGMALVRQIAASIARRIPSHIERDELIALGALGWVEARARFDAARGVPFSGFAAMRIRGAILDGLRAADTLSRSDRKRAKASAEPTAPRIFASEDEIDSAVDNAAADAAEVLQHEELRQELHVALATLPERERHVLSRHFFEDVPMKAIGIELGVTESRVSQIVTAAVAKLRNKFGIAILPRKKKASSAANSADGYVVEVAV
jgi:RNA polymerase sigma factor for flagellar operon FliA